MHGCFSCQSPAQPSIDNSNATNSRRLPAVTDPIVRKHSNVVRHSLGQAGHGVFARRRATLKSVGDDFLVRSERTTVAAGAE